MKMLPNSAYTAVMAFFDNSSSKNTVTLLGFPTRVRPGFLVFLAVLAFLYPFPLGIWIALTVAVFTVIHELGHALAARRAGCTASISLDFMIAYASYESEQPLPWLQRIRIALAGPVLQMSVAVALLIALGVNPFVRADIVQSDMTIALWWAGFALGALNLIPLLPLDGGAVVAAIAEKISPLKGREFMLRTSIGLTVFFAAATVLSGLVGLLPLFLFMLLMQWQSLAIPRRINRLARDPHFSSGGHTEIDSAIIASLIDQGSPTEALHYARRAYQQCPAFEIAISAARLSLSLGDTVSCISWLQAAEASQLHNDSVQREVARNSKWVQIQHLPGASAQWFAHR
jgi:Zn-dependent protease